jgi:MFS family permease
MMAVVALISWWAINAFIPIVSSGLAQATAKASGLDRAATLALVEGWKARATNVFNLGGLIGTLLTIPAAKIMGRRKMFGIYYGLSSLAIFATFGFQLAPVVRLYMYFFIGLTVFGVFGSFTYYLPELFPTRLRGTGAGFCYNVGRIVAAFGPFVVGTVASRGADALGTALRLLFWVGLVPVAGVLLAPLAVETKGRELA